MENLDHVTSAGHKPQGYEPSGTWQLDGWFMSNGHDIFGPFTLKEAVETTSNSHSPYHGYHLLSRLGYSRWYPKKHLAEIYRQYHQSEDLDSEQEFSTEINVQELLGWRKPQHHSGSPQGVVTSEQHQNNIAPIETAKQGKHKEQKDDTSINEPQKTSPEKPASTNTSTNRVKKRVFQPKTEGQWYMALKGQLRLGKIIPLARIFYLSTFSLGITNGLYIHGMLRDLHWNNPSIVSAKFHFSYLKSIFIFIIAPIPLLSGYIKAKLAQKIIRLQKSCGYSNCKMHIAILLSIFPPLSLVYLQWCLNQHWKYMMFKKIVKNRAHNQPGHGHDQVPRKNRGSRHVEPVPALSA
ncbi:MAG: hypothetical protein OXC40_07235 [Proteobacteria bacterium]|nr:hypothetical protein [Pseudomonadota bacterium]